MWSASRRAPAQSGISWEWVISSSVSSQPGQRTITSFEIDGCPGVNYYNELFVTLEVPSVGLGPSPFFSCVSMRLPLICVLFVVSAIAVDCLYSIHHRLTLRLYQAWRRRQSCRSWGLKWSILDNTICMCHCIRMPLTSRHSTRLWPTPLQMFLFSSWGIIQVCKPICSPVFQIRFNNWHCGVIHLPPNAHLLQRFAICQYLFVWIHHCTHYSDIWTGGLGVGCWRFNWHIWGDFSDGFAWFHFHHLNFIEFKT